MIFTDGKKWSYVEKIMLSLVEEMRNRGCLLNDYKIPLGRIKKRIFCAMKRDPDRARLMERQKSFNLVFDDEEVAVLVKDAMNALKDPDKYIVERFKKKQNSRLALEYGVFVLLIISTGMRSIDIHGIDVASMRRLLTKGSLYYISKNGRMLEGCLPEAVRTNPYFISACDHLLATTVTSDTPLFTYTRTRFNTLFARAYTCLLYTSRCV